jgi:uncharacterized protein (TIGR03437 family)
VRARDAQTQAVADTTYTVRTVAQARLQIAKVTGDGQSAPPGSLLPVPLRVRVRDGDGNAMIGLPVTFQASPGAQIQPATAATDENGEAVATLRLPAAPGIVLATALAGSAVVTFSAQAAGVSITNFPGQRSAGDTPLGSGKATIAQKGALLAAAASILRYYQNRGELSTVNGLADPALLNQYLKTFCGFDGQGNRVCDGFLSQPDSEEQVVNLWRLNDFAAGGLDILLDNPEALAAADAVAQGIPVLLGLTLTANAIPAGGHFVVAVGVDQDGGLLIHDPSPSWAKTRLNDYLSGFSTGGRVYAGKLTAAIRLLARSAPPRRFLLSSISQAGESSIDAQSAAGSCSKMEFQDLAVAGETTMTAPRVSRLVACDGSQALYQVGVSGAAQVNLTDYASGGGVRRLQAGIYRASRPATVLEVAPLSASLSSTVVNAATLTPHLAAGTLAIATGAGLVSPGGDVAVRIGGAPAQVVSKSAFQVVFEIPLGTLPGTHTLAVSSSYGTAETMIEVGETAPAIFLTAAGRPLVVNQDGTPNSAVAAAPRGQALVVYATGLGGVSDERGLATVRIPVTAVLDGRELPVSFAGSAPGMTGIYQVNVTLLNSTPPGLDLPLKLVQGSSESNAVPVSVQ